MDREIIAESQMAEKIEPFRILSLITQAQQKHGLRHENHQRYRGYCSRRIERIRKSLKFLNSHKCLPNRPAKFIPRKITSELLGDIRFLQILIFEVERNWAYAMQLKYETMDKAISRKKFQMRQKFRRAAKCAFFLQSLTDHNNLIHDVTLLEIKAYASFIHASLALELKNWKKAVDSFDAARLGYMELLEQVKGSELSEIYSAKCQEMENLLNLCRSHSGDSDFLLPTINSINLNASEDEPKSTKESEPTKQPKAEKERRRSKARLTGMKEPKPVKPFFFDLALNFIKENP